MSDRELLEWAAKAAGYEVTWKTGRCKGGEFCGAFIAEKVDAWNPLTDDGDALRLAVKCRIEIDHSHAQDQHRYVCASRRGCEMMYAPVSAVEEIEDDGQTIAATRRAIVRAAASIGQQMEK